jgi:ankyrin repeat protein
LYFAVSEAHDAVVEYLLSSDVENALALVGTTSQEDEPLRPAIPDTKEAADVDDAAGAFLRKHVNKACGPDKRTPLLEAVRWNRRPIAKLLLEHGADAKATSRNPFFTRTDWTALHVFAHAGHDTNLELVRDLIDNDVPVDGRSG